MKIQHLERAENALSKEVAELESIVAQLPPGSTHPDDLLARRMFEGLLARKRAMLGGVQREIRAHLVPLEVLTSQRYSADHQKC